MRHKKATWWLNWAKGEYPADSPAIVWLRELIANGNGEPMRATDAVVKATLKAIDAGEVE